MASSGYGMYGFNVLNVNGETSDLPVATLTRMTAQGFGNVLYFDEFQDLYGMVIPPGSAASGAYAALRAPVSGLYEIELSYALTNTAAQSLVRTTITVDKGINMAAGGLPNAGATAGSYVIGEPQTLTLAGASNTTSVYYKRRVFLEKDSVITAYPSIVFGTVSVSGTSTFSFFTLRCIDANNYNKEASQT